MVPLRIRGSPSGSRLMKRGTRAAGREFDMLRAAVSGLLLGDFSFNTYLWTY